MHCFCFQASLTSTGERKVRFSSDVSGSKSQLRRSLSSTDLRNLTGTGYLTDRPNPVITRGDLVSNGTALSSGSASADGNATGNSGYLGSSYSRNTGIAHIPSIGILNGANGHGMGGGRDANIAFAGGNLVGSSLGLSSGDSFGGIGSGTGVAGNYSRNISSGNFLSGDGATAGRFSSNNASGIGSASYLSANSGFSVSRGVLSGSALGIGSSLSGTSTGLNGSSISGVGCGSRQASSSFLSGNRGTGSSALGFLSSSSHRDGLSYGYSAGNSLGSGFGNERNNDGMQSSLSSGQRFVGSGQALSGSLGSASLGYRASSAAIAHQ